MKNRSLLKTSVLIAVSALCGGALLYRAAIVQGASIHLGCWGAVIGAFLAVAFAAGRVSLDTVGAAIGSLAALQFVPLLPCDGSIFMAPFVGAVLGAIAGFFTQELCRVASPNDTLKLTRPSHRG